MAEGTSGLLHATTGSGKTYAVWFGALARAAALGVPMRGASPPGRPKGEHRSAQHEGAPRTSPALGVLWLTPMRALAADSARAIRAPLADLAIPWSVGIRTGDTAPGERAQQDRRFPTALVTTPESLSLMLTREAAREELAAIHTVVVDEWHELMGSKRGVQVQLALARLKRWHPGLVVWGLSATLGNLDEAMHVLLGDERGRIVRGRIEKNLVIDTLLPANPGRFSWGGHLGKQMQLPVVEEIERSTTTLVFVNMRSQAEAWYQFILDARPDWAGVVALHHGSLDKEVRDWVELGLKEGRLKAVVATSSLDLGVDFLPVERVLQIGSAKGVARLLQRAGRSGHAPGRPSRITLVPTNTLELVEAVAARRAATAGQDREARCAREAVRRPRPASGDDRHRRRLQRRRDVRRGEGRVGVPQADARRVPVGARLRRPGRRQPARVPRVPPRRRRRRRLPGAEPGDRAPPQAQRRHDRERCIDAGEVPLGRQDRRRRGRLRRAAEEGRLLRLRRPHARVRPRPGDDGVRQARRRQEGVHDRLGGRQDAALERARRLGDGGPRRRRARRLLRSGDGSGAADARDADGALAHPDAEDLADRAARLARGAARVPLSVRRPQRPHRPRQPARVAALQGPAEHVLDRHQRLRARAAVCEAHRPDAAH